SLKIPYTIDPTLVRGLDYYNHTAFEIFSNAEGFGAITTLCGGGRYDGLVEEFGGPSTSGIGFAFSIERLIAALEAENIKPDVHENLDVYIATIGEKAEDYSVGLLKQLRNDGFSAERDYTGRKIKAQLKSADRLQAKLVIVLGDDELEKGMAQIKQMKTGEQMEISLDKLPQQLKELLQA